MTHDITDISALADRTVRLGLVARYLDCETTAGEEQALAAYYRTANGVADDEKDAAALILSLSDMDAAGYDAPSAEAGEMFDWLMAQADGRRSGGTVPRRRFRRIGYVVSAAAAAAAAVLAFVCLRPANRETPSPVQSAQVALADSQPSAPYPSPLASADSDESKTSVPSTQRLPSSPKCEARKTNRSATALQPSPADKRAMLSEVLESVCTTAVNVGIERKGNAFIVTACSADGTVHTYIVDAADDTDIAVYAPTVTGEEADGYGAGASDGVHGPCL